MLAAAARPRPRLPAARTSHLSLPLVLHTLALYKNTYRPQDRTVPNVGKDPPNVLPRLESLTLFLESLRVEDEGSDEVITICVSHDRQVP